MLGSGPGGEPGSGCARATQPAPRDLTCAELGSSASEGMVWTAPLRGVRSSRCLWTSESSSSSPGEGALAPSMDRRQDDTGRPETGCTHPRVQSPKLPPGWLTLHPPPPPAPGGLDRAGGSGGSGGRPQAAGGAVGSGAEQRRAVFLVCSGRSLHCLSLFLLIGSRS